MNFCKKSVLSTDKQIIKMTRSLFLLIMILGGWWGGSIWCIVLKIKRIYKCDGVKDLLSWVCMKNDIKTESRNIVSLSTCNSIEDFVVKCANKESLLGSSLESQLHI